ncbi:MAG: SulP family inorganic anion transporter [Thermoflexibacter sp.]
MQMNHVPQDGLGGLKENWRQDLNAGVLVSFLALPLCLGIASASQFPPITGIFTAIIGGIVVSFFAGSPLTIKGPAAGLIAIALASIEAIGYERTLAVIFVASLLQIIFGVIKVGKYGNLFPIAVVHGILVAIGIIIFSKQIYLLLGVSPKGNKPFELLAEIPHSLAHARWEVAFTGIIGLFVIFYFPHIRNRFIKKIPAPMWVLLITVPLSSMLGLREIVLDGKPIYLVHIPSSILEGILNLDKTKIGITFPDFSALVSWESGKYVLMFSLIGSIESLLIVKAMDNLDPFHRKSDMNKDLIAIGIGNAIASLMGALPMIAEIVRSTANITNGAKTRWANFFHGVALLVFILGLAKIIMLIPMTALAAMLIAIAYSLASPKEFIYMFRMGKKQSLVFLSTLLITLATDLLVGIIIGILIHIVLQFLHYIVRKYASSQR